MTPPGNPIATLNPDRWGNNIMTILTQATLRPDTAATIGRPSASLLLRLPPHDAIDPALRARTTPDTSLAALCRANPILGARSGGF